MTKSNTLSRKMKNTKSLKSKLAVFPHKSETGILRKTKKSVGLLRSHMERLPGKIIGYYAQRKDEDSKLQKKELEKLYKKIHGNVSDNYEEIRKFIRSHPSILPSVQGIFDLELERMGRNDKMSVDEEDDDFEVTEPTAVVFVHNLLNDDVPDLTMTNYTQEEAQNIVENNALEYAVLSETKPKGQLGGKKKKTRKNRKNRK